MVWRGRQSQALTDATRYLDIEGAIRSSKTTIGLWKVLNACLEHPGMRWLVTRWSDDDVSALIKPLLRLMFEQVGLAAEWFPDEHRFELPNGSWIYVRGLRPSENTSRFSKFRGMTLAGILVDQAEEIPEDFALELKGRLSQPGYSAWYQLIFTPNPPNHDHWLTEMFPETDGAPNHKYIRLALDDNAHNLDSGYVEGLKQQYATHPSQYRTLIEGKRGLATSGKPVYGGYFQRERHGADVTLVPDVPLVEAIDFGHHHPCVLWMQFLPWGELRWLGALMGEDMYIEDFAPLIAQYRAHWFHGYSEVWSCCDPAGTHENSQGTRKNGVMVLRENEIYPRSVAHSNMPDVRDYAVQTIAGYMRRRSVRGEAFQVSTRDRWYIVGAKKLRVSNFILDALEAGYVFDERVRRSAGGKSIIVPLKDGYYEHGMNCAEYGLLNYGPPRPSAKDERKAQVAMERAVTAPDRDPMDEMLGRGRFARRGGNSAGGRRPGGF